MAGNNQQICTDGKQRVVHSEYSPLTKAINSSNSSVVESREDEDQTYADQCENDGGEGFRELKNMDENANHCGCVRRTVLDSSTYDHFTRRHKQSKNYIPCSNVNCSRQSLCNESSKSDESQSCDTLSACLCKGGRKAPTEFQQRHSEISNYFIKCGYTPSYAQVLAATMINAQLACSTAGYSVSAAHQALPYVWTGELPQRNYSNPVFSNKVFVGGVPWDIAENALTGAFSNYGNCRVEWPGSHEPKSRYVPFRRFKATGYVYIIFENDIAVKRLLENCSQEFGGAGEWYFKLNARRANTKELRQVQIIPWVISDATYMQDEKSYLDPKKTVFVGALHGMITARVLFSIMKDVYDDVLFAGIDTDRYRYPIGKHFILTMYSIVRRDHTERLHCI